MSSSQALPEVSLITSWLTPRKDTGTGQLLPPSLGSALNEGIDLFDLYFVSHEDIPWYAARAGIADYEKEPHEFASLPTPPEIRIIADTLRDNLSESYGGSLVGRRPRFAALATFFPNLSLPPANDLDRERRNMAVRAVRNALYLAYCLGCSCVEIVGGAGAPGTGFTPKDEGEARNQNDPAEAYRTLRRQTLATSIGDVYNLTEKDNPLNQIPKDRTLPVVAMELEPGYSFLMNSLAEFVELRKEVERQFGAASEPYRHLMLNIDIAHAFLIGYTREKVKEQSLDSCVAHMHISDHGGDKLLGGSHSADLPPGTYHPFWQYKPWLELAVERAREPRSFTGAIAIEMEACNDLAPVLAAMSTARRWLEKAGENPPKDLKSPPRGPLNGSSGMVEGAVLTIDIGNSTERLLRGDAGIEGSAHLEQKVRELCAEVLRRGGSVMSFTGDGLIALFEEVLFPPAQGDAHTARAAKRALEVAEWICDQFAGMDETTVRAALHWGKVYIPTSGPLRDQIIGLDVVCCARLCDWLAHQIEPAIPPAQRAAIIGATRPFHDQFPTSPKSKWKHWGAVEFKGIKHKQEIYLHKTTINFLPDEDG